MATTKIIFCLLSLLAIRIDTANCLFEDYSYEEDSTWDRSVEEEPAVSGYMLNAPAKLPVHSLIDSLVPKLLNTNIGKLIFEAVLDTPKFVSKVNDFVGTDILILKGNNLSISLSNVTELIRFGVREILEGNLRLRGIILNIVSGYLNNIVDFVSQRIKPLVNSINFEVSSKPIGLQGPNLESIGRKLVLELVITLLRPFQSRVNQTLFKATEDLLNIYNPILPNNYFKSIVTCGINQTILRVLGVIDSVREAINELLAPSSRLKDRSLETEDEKKTLIGFIISPIRSLLVLISTPVHRFLEVIMNIVLFTLRPIVGPIVLSPIEILVRTLINLIPCSDCHVEYGYY